MRILGILLLIVSLGPLGWGGYVEFVYISNGQQKFDERMDEAEVKFNESLVDAEKRYKDRMNEIAANPNFNAQLKKSMTDTAKDIYDKALEAQKSSYQKARVMMQEGLDQHIEKTRNETMSMISLIAGLILLLAGGFLAFRRRVVE